MSIDIDFETLEKLEYFGLEIIVPPEVYGPMEDTDLSIRFLREWLHNFGKSETSRKYNEEEKPIRILEMGIGSGVLSLYLVSRFLRKKIKFEHLGIDINPIAVKTAKFNAKINNLATSVDFIQGDLFNSLKEEKKLHEFDFILFNPPYLASEPETINASNRKLIDYAWEGGENGYEVTLKFLQQIDPFLSDYGELFYISSSRVDQSKIQKKLENLQLKLVKKYEKRVFFEKIILYHYKR